MQYYYRLLCDLYFAFWYPCWLQNAASLEAMAHELQKKVVSLQGDKDSLEEELALCKLQPGKGDSSDIMSARERQENLELKVFYAFGITFLYSFERVFTRWHI